MGESHSATRRTRPWREGLDVIATIAFVVFCAVGIWTLLGNRTFVRAAGSTGGAADRARAQPPAPLPTEPLSLDGANVRGNAAARVAMIVYSEFKCPYCGAFARDTFPGLMKKYVISGRVRFAFRQFPLDQIHPLARPAAIASLCAGQQNKFWDLHDRLFASQQSLSNEAIQKYVDEVGVRRPAFDECVKSNAPLQVQADVDSGRKLGVSGTPTFFIGSVGSDGRVKVSERLTGAKPAKEYEVILDRLLSDSPSK